MTERDCEELGLELPADPTQVCDEQVERALKRLDDGGELTSQQRAAVERLADRLTAGILGMFDADPGATETGDGEKRIALFSD